MPLVDFFTKHEMLLDKLERNDAEIIELKYKINQFKKVG